jgi:hypothetical protein
MLVITRGAHSRSGAYEGQDLEPTALAASVVATSISLRIRKVAHLNEWRTTLRSIPDEYSRCMTLFSHEIRECFVPFRPRNQDQ